MDNILFPLILIGAGLFLISQPAKGYIMPRNQTMPALIWTTPPQGQKYDPYFRQAERMYSLPPGLLSRVALQESSYNPEAKGESGEVGIMQIIPRWHPSVNAADPVASIFYAGKYLRENYNRFGSWREALAAYNWGPTVLARKGFDAAPASTKQYVYDVLADIGHVSG